MWVGSDRLLDKIKPRQPLRRGDVGNDDEALADDDRASEGLRDRREQRQQR